MAAYDAPLFVEMLLFQRSFDAMNDFWQFAIPHHLLACTLSVRKYLSSKWIERDVSRIKIRLDTSPFIHFDDKYFRTEGVYHET